MLILHVSTSSVDGLLKKIKYFSKTTLFPYQGACVIHFMFCFGSICRVLMLPLWSRSVFALASQMRYQYV